MGLFGQVGDMYKLQKEAKRIKAELAKTHIFAEHEGIKVTVNGEQQVVSIEFLNDSLLSDKNKLSKALIEALNRAMKKAQMVAAEKMKAVMGGFPGMGQ
ncbi:YbaB/EbfC family nucleoid-associated protein [Candidatus Gracilibacteria bacterium]|nr:YbaB/EbfC family nucleoid-associated protein [Candidatus Gracilibacteria bacterium]